MAHKPVGTGSSLAITGVAATTSAISHQTEAVRICAVGSAAHVAIGTEPIATHTDYYIASGTSAVLSAGRPSSQKVVGVTTGTTTTIDFPQGTGSPFAPGDTVSLTITGAQSYLNFSHKFVESVNTTSGVGGYFNTRIVVTHDSSGISTNYSDTGGKNNAELRSSFKVSGRTDTGSGKLYIQQVQITGAQ